MVSMDDVMKDVKKKYGEESMIRMSDKPKKNVDVISTGSLALDIALGVRGYPRGRIVELMGWESSGKTTMALHAIAEAQKLGLEAAFIDAEHALDPPYAEAIGVSMDHLWINQPDSGEQALDILETVVRSGAVGIVVVDSVAALVPKHELDGEIGDAHIGLQARMMSQACRKLSGAISKTNTLVIFINQYRKSIGGFGFGGGGGNVTSGGNALKFYASVRLEVARKQTIKVGGEAEANRTLVKVKKNKVAPPGREVEFDIDFGVGISRVSEVIEYSEKFGLIKKSGAWYKNDKGETLAQGKESMKALLKEDSNLARELEEKILNEISEGVDRRTN